MRRSWVEIPSNVTAWTLATRFSRTSQLCRICIALGSLGWYGQSERILFTPKLFLFDSGPSSAVLIGTCLSAVICSTVLLVGFSRRFFTALEPFCFRSRKPALFATEDLGGMIAHKRTIARLPQATAMKRIRLRILRSQLVMIRIGNGQSGVLVP